MSIHQGYYAIIPANVRYSKEVSDGAKLLYGEITALCDKSGYCWASNAYFAALYSASNRTVSRWISELARAGFIVTLADNAAANSRKIWIKDGVPHDKNVHTPTTKMSIPPRQKWRDPMDKNVQRNTTVNTTVNILPIGSDRAPENSLPSKAEFSPIPNSAAPLSPSWGDRPNTTTPARMVDDLRIFYATHSEDFKVMCETAKVRFDSEKMREVLTAFCSYRIKTNQTADTYQNHHAALQKWLIDEKTMRRQPVTAPGTAPQEIRYKNDKPMRY